MPVETGQPRWLSYSFSVSSGPLWFRSTGRDAGRDRTAGWLPYSFSVSSVPLWFRSTGRDSGRNRTAGWLSYSFFVSSGPLWFRSTGRDAGRNRTAKMAVLLILRVLGTSGVQIDRQGCRGKHDSQDGCPGQPGWLSYSFSVSSYLCGFNSLELFDEPAGGAMGVKCSLKADKSRVRVALSDRSLPVIQVRNRLIAAIHKRTEEQRPRGQSCR